MRNIEEVLLHSFENLSPASHVAVAVLNEISHDDVGAADLALIIATDPVLTAKIMRMANSSMYSRRGQVSQLNVAIALLGLRTVQSIALTSVLQMVSPIDESDWLHSITTAMAATQLAPVFGIDSGEAFSVGMLHDLGVSLFREYDREGYQRILSEVNFPPSQEDQDRLLSLEFERYGTTHPHLGSMVMQSWSLPIEMLEAVRHHHDSSRQTTLTRLLRAADLFSYYVQYSIEPDEPIVKELSYEETLTQLHRLKEQSRQTLLLVD
ncbi:HD-like signal output (HDOD) domain, no enzymatic activity [Ferrithrix thermotolerans DSM 19514]|uniref:HD-like signal output (HDOD) domain, no enzymatic activity n=1 Tax=Ferrithrix thermotolerans DSM 19514 TaxID=1121881 RepID=A0A1M4XHE4_9ACTN|nr:HDOD domain-containing protein [Ferrithrix thermotolerans]SHE92786.1 HD-like signal output (HDOD) domain, no enzymatic activity [Ferrithrix thermotolerans DSM 19514]